MKILNSTFMLLLLACSVWYYQHRATVAENGLKTTATELSNATAYISNLETKNRLLAELDKRHTEELASAKKQNTDLRDAVHAGAKRLHVSATCPAVPAGNPASPASVDDAAAARLTADAERHYFRLREQIATVNAQINGLQDYIREQCQKHTD